MWLNSSRDIWSHNKGNANIRFANVKLNCVSVFFRFVFSLGKFEHIRRAYIRKVVQILNYLIAVLQFRRPISILAYRLHHHHISFVLFEWTASEKSMFFFSVARKKHKAHIFIDSQNDHGFHGFHGFVVALIECAHKNACILVQVYSVLYAFMFSMTTAAAGQQHCLEMQLQVIMN